MDPSLFAFGPTGWGDELARGLGVTLALAGLAWALGTALGVAVGLLELRAHPLAARPLGTASAVLRALPELLVVTVVFYAGAWTLESALALVGIDVGVTLGPFAAGVIALGLVQAAYTAEVVKGAVRSVPHGMHEAARSLGLGRAAHARTITFPLALRHALPGLANLWMVIVKNTPFVSAIGVADLTAQAATAGQNTKRYFAFFGAVLAAYLVISALSMRLQVVLERRAERHLAPSGR